MTTRRHSTKEVKREAASLPGHSGRFAADPAAFPFNRYGMVDGRVETAAAR